jgi:hypothetical protein
MNRIPSAASGILVLFTASLPPYDGPDATLKCNIYAMTLHCLEAAQSSSHLLSTAVHHPLFASFLGKSSLATISAIISNNPIDEDVLCAIVATPFFAAQFRKALTDKARRALRNLHPARLSQMPRLISHLDSLQIPSHDVLAMVEKLAQRMPLKSQLNAFRRMPRDRSNFVFRHSLHHSSKNVDEFIKTISLIAAIISQSLKNVVISWICSRLRKPICLKFDENIISIR